MKKNVDMDGVLYTLTYRGVGPIVIGGEPGWYFDEMYPPNVCHHLMSLRWVRGIKSKDVKKNIVNSFVRYHKFSRLSSISIYYLGKHADHTASIRLTVLLELLKEFEEDKKLSSLVRGEMIKTISSCLVDTYKENNNHGLMVDKSILKCIGGDACILKLYRDKLGFVADRIEKQVDGIFDEDGYCKEHSTSYQEFNMGIMLDLLCLLEETIGSGFSVTLKRFKERVEKIKEASRKSLGFLLKDDCAYVTIGDSFSEVKPSILAKAFGSKDPKNALQPYSSMKGVFHNKTLGVSVYRDSFVHLALNSCWHSGVHKQNDDLSFFLRVNGEDLFIDGGYSDIVSKKLVPTRSEELHSTVLPDGKKWIGREKRNSSKYSILNEPKLGCNYEWVLFSGAHNRCQDVEVERSVIVFPNEGILNITDRVFQSSCRHRFIVPKEVEVSVEGNTALLKTNKNYVKLKAKNCEGIESGWSVSDIEVIGRGKVVCCHALDFSSCGSLTVAVSYK